MMTLRRSFLLGVLLAFWACLPCFADDNARVLANPSLVRCGWLAKDGHFAQAIPICDQVVKRYPNAGWGYHWRSVAYRGLGRLDEAIQDGETALQHLDHSDPTYEQWYKESLSLSYQLHGNTFWHAGGDLPKAVADYSRAIDLTPETVVWPRLSRGLFYYWSGRWQEAAADFGYFANLYRIEPHYTIALTLQGRCYLKLGNQHAALENVRKLMEIQPRLAAPYGGDAALDLYDVAQRRERAREALRLALAAEQSGNMVEAFQQCRRAREYPLIINWLYPGDWANAGFEDYDGKGDADLAREMSAVLMRLYRKLPMKPGLPEEGRRFSVQAEAAVKDKHYDEAIALYGKLIDVAPWWTPAQFNIALLLGEQQRYTDAITWMKGYLSWAPNAPDARQAQDKIYEWERLVNPGAR
jgi:tetratricopeptide (TPR) repeat protein